MLRTTSVERVNQAIRFIAVGILNTILSYFVFAILWSCFGNSWHHQVLLISSYALVTTFAFILQRLIVFRGQNPVAQSFRRYVVVTLAGFLVNSLLLEIFTSVGRVDILMGQGISLGASASVTFFLHRRWTFRTNV